MKIYGSDNSDIVVNELGFALKKVGHTILQDIVLSNRLGFLFRGTLEYGEHIEHHVFVPNEFENFVDDDASPYPKKSNKDVSFWSSNWIMKQDTQTVTHRKIAKVVRNGDELNDYVGRMLAKFSATENLYLYKELKKLIAKIKDGVTVVQNFIDDDDSNITLVWGDTGNITENTTIDELIMLIKNTVSSFTFANYEHCPHAVVDDETYYYIRSEIEVPLDNILICMPYQLVNKIDVEKLAQVFNLSKMDMFAKIIPIDNDDENIYIFDKRMLGYYNRMRKITNTTNEKKHYTNFFYTIENNFYIAPTSKATYIDVSAMLNNADNLDDDDLD